MFLRLHLLQPALLGRLCLPWMASIKHDHHVQASALGGLRAHCSVTPPASMGATRGHSPLPAARPAGTPTFWRGPAQWLQLQDAAAGRRPRPAMAPALLGRSQQQQGAGTFARATRIGALGVNKLLRMCKPFLEGCGLPVSAFLNICKPSWESGELPLSASALHAMLGTGRSGKTSAAATSPSNVPTS